MPESWRKTELVPFPKRKGTPDYAEITEVLNCWNIE